MGINKKKIIVTTVLLVELFALTLLGWGAYPAKAASCDWQLYGFKGSTIINPSKTVTAKTSESTQFKIGISSSDPGCVESGSEVYFRADYYILPESSNGTAALQGPFKFFEPKKLTISGTGINIITEKLGDAKEGTYTYKFYQLASQYSPLSLSTKTWVLTFDNDGKLTSPPSNSNTNNPNTNLNINGSAGGLANINTNVGISGVPDFDQSIGDGLFNPIEYESLPQIVVRAIQILFALVAGLAVIVIIIAGFRMVAFGSNESEVTKAKQALTWAIIGLVVSLLSFSIVAIIQRVI